MSEIKECRNWKCKKSGGDREPSKISCEKRFELKKMSKWDSNVGREQRDEVDFYIDGNIRCKEIKSKHL